MSSPTMGNDPIHTLTARENEQLMVILVNNNRLITDRVSLTDRWATFQVGSIKWDVPVAAIVAIATQPQQASMRRSVHDGSHGPDCLVCHPPDPTVPDTQIGRSSK